MHATTADAYITLNIDDQAIAWLTLNRPDVHNAFDDVMIGQILAALEQVRENPAVRALVLQSNGKHFSAGADLNWMRSMADKTYEQNLADSNELGALMWELDRLPIPTLALVDGAAFGGAVGLVACCDLALASERASFCLSEVKIGLIPAVISPYVVRAMGARQARRYMLTAERFKADKALAMGLVHDVVDQDLLEAAQPFLNTLAGNGPAAMMAAKRLVQDVAESPLTPELVTETARRIAEIRVSDEGQEGLNAFLDKRTPSWAQED